MNQIGIGSAVRWFWGSAVEFKVDSAVLRLVRTSGCGAARGVSHCHAQGRCHAAARPAAPAFLTAIYLSDRDLYAHLWHHTLRDEVPDVEPKPDEGACHVDLLGAGNQEDTQVFLRHCADDAERQRWLADFPDYPMPPHEDPAYDRDRYLPKPYVGH